MSTDIPSLNNSLVAFYFIFADKGFPSGSVVFGVGGDEHFVPDAAVIDPKSGLELAFLEVRDNLNEIELASLARNHIELCSRKGRSLPVYLISTSVSNEYEPRIFALSSENRWIPIQKEDFPTFEVLGSRRALEHMEASKEKAVSTAGDFRRVSQIFAVFLLALLFADFFHVVSITQEHLLLLLGAAVLTVLPYFSIIKALGLFELKRDDESSNRKVK